MTNVMTRASLKWYVCSHVYPRMPWHMCLTAVPGEENKGGMRTWYIPTYDVRSNRRADERRQKKKVIRVVEISFLTYNDAWFACFFAERVLPNLDGPVRFIVSNTHD